MLFIRVAVWEVIREGSVIKGKNRWEYRASKKFPGVVVILIVQQIQIKISH